MKKILIVLASLSILLFAATAQADIISTFTDGDEGWLISNGTISLDDGYITGMDAGAGYIMTANAPAKFKGDLSAYIGGVLSFDVANLSGLPSNRDIFGTVRITSGSRTITYDLSAPGDLPTDGTWTTYSASLTKDIWGSDLLAVLSNVTSLSVFLEYSNTRGGLTGFDNFSILAPQNQPVPVPAAIWLMGSGLAGIVTLRRKMQ